MHKFGTVYGETLRLWVADILYIFVCNPAEIEVFYLHIQNYISITFFVDFKVFLTNKKCNNKGRTYDILHMWLGKGLLTSSSKYSHDDNKVR